MNAECRPRCDCDECFAEGLAYNEACKAAAMTARDDLREAVIAALTKGDWISPRLAGDIADAALSVAIPRIEAETREACAKVADNHYVAWALKQQVAKECNLRCEYRDNETMGIAAIHIAAAIRNQEPKA